MDCCIGDGHDTHCFAQCVEGHGLSYFPLERKERDKNDNADSEEDDKDDDEEGDHE